MATYLERLTSVWCAGVRDRPDAPARVGSPAERTGLADPVAGASGWSADDAKPPDIDATASERIHSEERIPNSEFRMGSSPRVQRIPHLESGISNLESGISDVPSHSFTDAQAVEARPPGDPTSSAEAAGMSWADPFIHAPRMGPTLLAAQSRRVGPPRGGRPSRSRPASRPDRSSIAAPPGPRAPRRRHSDGG